MYEQTNKNEEFSVHIHEIKHFFSNIFYRFLLLFRSHPFFSLSDSGKKKKFRVLLLELFLVFWLTFGILAELG